MASLWIPARPADGHKGTFGRALIIAGSRGFSGAAALAGTAALRGGGGGLIGPPSLCLVDLQSRLKWPSLPQPWQAVIRAACPLPAPSVPGGGLARKATVFPFRRSSRSMSPSSVTTSSLVSACPSVGCSSTLLLMGAAPLVRKRWRVCR